MPVVWSNNGVSTLAAGISASDPTLTVAAGHGARFPSGLTSTAYCIITVQNGSTFEIMHAVGRTGDVLTVVRAQEGTSAASFALGSSVECRVTAGGLNSLFSRLGGVIENLLGISKGSGQEARVTSTNLSTGARRWEQVLGNSVLESGGDAGSDYALRRYSDADALLGTPIAVTRSNGNMTLTSGVFSLSATGSATLAATTSIGLTATGALTLSGATLGLTGNTLLTGTLGVSGALTVSAGGLTVSAGGAAVTGALGVSGGSITAARSDGNIASLRAENTNTSGGFSSVVLRDERAATGLRRWDVRNEVGVLRIGQLDDAESVFTERLSISTGGNITTPGTITAGGTLLGPQTNVQTFNASGTWTKPSGYSSGTRVMLQAWGGGGSGSRDSSGVNTGGGGAGYSERLLLLSDLGATETITVGAGGVSRTGSDQNGANGGNSSVGSLLTAYGGGGGGRAVANSYGGGGGLLGAGGVNTGGAGQFSPFNGGGGAGQDAGLSPYAAFPAAFGGGGGGLSTPSFTAGGVSAYGGNGGNGGSTGTAGAQPGGGGGGATSTSGAGGAGRVIITVFG